MHQPDQLYAHPQAELSKFRFDEPVVQVFPDMIKRSVPGYSQIIAMTGLIGKRFAQDNSVIYDLGCSLGASSLAIRQQVQASNCRIIGIDSSAAMLSRAKQYLDMQDSSIDLSLEQADICQYDYQPCSFVAVNLTLQFIAVAERLPLLQRLATACLPGAALLLTEKVCFADPVEQQLMTDLHHDFKRANGYSELEISQKRQAIDNVLLPESMDQHCQRLLQAGFQRVLPWYRNLNFVSFLAIK